MEQQPIAIVVSSKMDELNRIVIPNAVQREIGLNPGDKIFFYKTQDNSLVLRREAPLTITPITEKE